MILERLIELRNRLADDPESGLATAYHAKQGIKWILNVSTEGKFQGFISTGEKKKDWKEFEVPYKHDRTSGNTPLLLADKREYVIGIDENDDAKNFRSKIRHRCYADLVERCKDLVDNASLNSFVEFLNNDREVYNANVEADFKEIKKSDFILPVVGGIILTNLPEVRRFWQMCEDDAVESKSSLTAECMVCGKQHEIARTHSVNLKIGRDRPVLVGGNEPAFWSYGLKQSEIAPMCRTCARSYGEGLAWLLQSDGNRIRINDVTWVFWTRKPVEFNFASILTDPSPEDVRELLLSPQKGRHPSIEDNCFFALALSTMKSRLRVRNWLSTSIADAVDCLNRYFENQQIATYRQDETLLSIRQLAASLVPTKNKRPDWDKLPPQVLPALLNHALLGTPLPLSLLQRALGRARAERENVMTRPRAALIKMVLLSNSYSHEDIMPVLNPDHPNPAYHCGRLLAVLERIQEEAVGADATLIDRYYGSASSTPAIVFGILFRNAQYHLGKLRKTKIGLYYYYERLLGDIVSHLQDFPKTLSPSDQGLFALGFFQQKNFRKADTPVSGNDSEIE